jgi:hypothetical protein
MTKESKESGLDQDPYQEKNTFTSITRVSVIEIEHVSARLIGLSAAIVLSSRFVVTCALGLMPKSHIPSIAHDGTLSFRYPADIMRILDLFIRMTL